MQHLRSTLFAMTLVAFASPALAVDVETSPDAPDLTAVRAKLSANDYKGAAADLDAMVDAGVQHPDVYNLLGFSLRHAGDTKTALTYYQKALDFDPNHKGALEYEGELYVQVGQLDRARDNAAKLAKLCPQGCEELDDLQKAIKQGAVTN